MNLLASERRRNGFTIIELLTVIAIVALLMAMLIPSLKHVHDSGLKLVCRNNLRQIDLAIHAYANDHRRRAPFAMGHELGGATGLEPIDSMWGIAWQLGGGLPADQRVLNPYINHDHALFCSPCDKGEPYAWEGSCEEHPYRYTSTAYELYGSSYVYVSGYRRNEETGVWPRNGLGRFVGPSAVDVEPDSQYYLVRGECAKLEHYKQPAKKVIVGSITVFRSMAGAARNRQAWWYKHDTRCMWANVAFVDGHVEFVLVFPYNRTLSLYMPPDESNPYY